MTQIILCKDEKKTYEIRKELTYETKFLGYKKKIEESQDEIDEITFYQIDCETMFEHEFYIHEHDVLYNASEFSVLLDLLKDFEIEAIDIQTDEVEEVEDVFPVYKELNPIFKDISWTKYLQYRSKRHQLMYKHKRIKPFIELEEEFE